MVIRRRLIAAGLIVLVLAAMYPLQGRVERTRARYGLCTDEPLKDLPPGEFFGTVLLGGFRAIAVDLIWLKTLEAEKNRDWHRHMVLNKLIASVQPRFVPVWEFNMWNMTYNLSLAAPTDEEGWEWVKRGLEFGTEGFRRNPDSWKLAYALGYQYFHVCGTLGSERARKYQKWLFEETGRTNWQHALTWFTRAWEIAGPAANPNWLDMLSATHRKIAYEAEEKGDLDTMVQHRNKAITWLQTIREKYPDNEKFNRYAASEIRDLRGRLKAHEREKRAATLRSRNETTEEFELLRDAAAYWMTAYEGNPYEGEQGRHLAAIAQRFEEMTPTADAELKGSLESRELEIWLRLISSPEYIPIYIEKCEKLDTRHTARLRETIAADDRNHIMDELSNVLRLRHELFDKEPQSAQRAESMRRIAAICEELALTTEAPDSRETLDSAIRAAWFKLLTFNHRKGSDAGIARMKRWAEAVQQRIGRSSDERSEALRQEMVEVLSLFHAADIQRAWADVRLRETGEYYTDSFIQEMQRDNQAAAADAYRRSRAIWQRIRQRHPDDAQARENLNRMAKALTIVVQQTP